MGTTLSNWTPSPARTLSVPLAQSPALRGETVISLDLTWPAKQSADVCDFALDPTAWLTDANDSLADDCSASAPAVQAATDLVLIGCCVASGYFVVFAGGGTPGTVSVVTCTLLTRGGLRKILNIRLQIAKGVATACPPYQMLPGDVFAPPNAIRLGDGSILVTEAGAPVLS